MSEDRDEGSAGTPVPVGDSERQKAVDALCEAFADDRLGVDEFERRVELAHRAATLQELRVLLGDLPRAHGGVPAIPEDRRRAAAETRRVEGALGAPHPLLDADKVRDTSFIVGILGGGTRRGAWRPARHNYAVGVLGGFELDFRETPLPPGVTEVRVFAFWGGGEIIVPPDVIVEVSTVGILGGFEYRHEHASTQDPDAPVLRITGLAVMGGGEVSVRYPGETKRDSRRRRRELRRERRRRLKRGEDE